MFISLDLETTGFDPTKDKIIEFGAVKFDMNGEKERLQFLVNPGITLPQIITHITRITDNDLKDAPPFHEKAEEVKNFIGDLPIIGHNIQFDTNFLRENGLEIKNPEYDTVQLSTMLLPGLASYSLEILSHTLDLQHKEKHRALDDAIAAMELFIKLAEEFQTLPPEIIERIKPLLQKTNWPLKDFLLKLELKESKEKTKETTEEKTPSALPLPKFYKELLDTSSTGLFQQPPPYKNLTKKLVTEIDKDSYVAAPHQLFRRAEKDLPDTIAKIDSPSKYISPKRLEEFEKNDFFENHEISALLKYIIWINQTKTGLLSEIMLFHREKETIPKINIDKNFADPEKEHFFQRALKKDENSSALCSHDYLIEKKPKIKDLVIIDIDKFTKTLFYHLSGYLKLDILLNQLKELKRLEPENQTIESLSSKSTILFGLIGIIFDKSNDRNIYIARATITESVMQSTRWEDVKQAVSNLIEISKELGEIKNEKTLPYLKNWKSSLEILQKTFLYPDLNTSTIWIEKDLFDNIVIRSTPFSLKPQLKEILDNCENYKILSENLDIDDNGLFIKKLLGLDKDLPLYLGEEKREDLEILINKDTPKDDNTLARELVPYLQKKKGKTAIIFNSKQQLKYFTLKLTPYLSKNNIKTVSQLTGSLGKLREKFKQDPQNSILLITPNFWENFKDHDLIETLIIYKIPFDPPSDPFIVAMSQNFEDPFNEFQIPKAVFALKKIINRLNISEEQKEVVILDSRLITKNYGNSFIKALTSIATPIVKIFHH